ncbi:tetratricopeptide repeat protein 38-like, partial [Stylophora pistillata]|uniref:tetratricopeptide repeat protein 38-like n=1 Tax=Stylophora pistillata TaxID=50429 RepID=UPI000C038C9C
FLSWSKVGKRCHSGAMLDLVDVSSLLYRLQLEGNEIKDRWRELFHLWESHTDDHILVFNDVHMLMCTLGAKKEDATLNLLMSLRDYVRGCLPSPGTPCVFNDVHMLMCTLGAKKEDATLNLLMSLSDYVRDGSGTNCEVSREIGLALCEAFEQGNFHRAVDILKPLRCDVVNIGGSNAQQDIFDLFPIYAALNSSRKEHHHLAR